MVIGRNEGQRLLRCLKSILGSVDCVVYVDSGSTDSSQESAAELGAGVVSLDPSQPFTAARARNTGFDRLVSMSDDIEYIQFVDGDCEVDIDWVSKAVNVLQETPDIGIVCGRRRERNPAGSVYNQLCDLEWDTPIGYAASCGGDFMIRRSAFQQVNGFNADLIAGEEPDLCHRMRRQGWKVLRVDEEMTLHDAAITRFGQWWTRNIRSGHAYAEATWMHFGEPGHDGFRNSARIWLWGGVIPLFVLLGSLVNPVSLGATLIYPIQVARIALGEGASSKSSWQYAFFVTLGKFPEMQGQLKYLGSRLSRSRNRIIEYK